MEFPPCPFWDFSLQAYGSDGVAPACLKLQERHGIDVNILLYCIWAGHIGNRLNKEQIAILTASVGEWHGAVVRSLRQARKQMKTPLDGQAPSPLTLDLRARIQKLEIDAEHIEQLRLHASLENAEFIAADPGVDLAKCNAIDYFSFLEIEPDDEDHQILCIVCGPATDLGRRP